MDDVQSRHDDREIAIDQVGVSNLRYPIVVLDREHQQQETIATLSLSVDLPHHFKGTHMSRFIEVLNHYRGEVTMRTLPEILLELRKRLDAKTAADLMHSPAVWVTEETTLDEMAKLLIREAINELPVVDENEHLVGQVNVYETIKAYLELEGVSRKEIEL